MPIGTRHQVEGVLLRDRGGPMLNVHDGGTWRLEAQSAATRLLSRRVRAAGIRIGFDLLAVQTI